MNYFEIMVLSDSICMWLTDNAVRTDWMGAQLATSIDSISFDFSFWAYLRCHS